LLFLVVLLLAVAVVFLVVDRSRAAGGDIDPTFNAGQGPFPEVQAVAIQPDGKIVIGGPFTNFNGVAAPRITRLNADGTRDTTFNAGGTGPGPVSGPNETTVYAVAVQPDGKIVIGGTFASYNGDAAASDFVMRLNANGTRDTTFNASGTGANGSVIAVTIQPDGKIVIVGNFTSYNGDAAASDFVMRLNADGTRDTTFNAGGTGANSQVAGVAIQPDGKIVIGGPFTSYNGDPAASDGIMRLNADGTRDTTFNAGGTGADHYMVAAAVQPDGKIVIVGNFTSYNGDAAASDFVMRLNADGTRDTTFNAGGAGAENIVYAVALQPDGKIVIGGIFPTYNGDPPRGVTRLNANGTRNTTFNAGGTGTDGLVSAMAMQPDGKIVIVGEFLSYNGTPVNRIMRLLTFSPNQAPSFTKGADQTVNEDAGAQTINSWATNISPGPPDDESGQTVTFQVTGNTNAALFSAGPAISPTGVLTYTPVADANGSAQLTINLKDNGGTSNGGVDTSPSQTFTITVNSVNDVPSFIKGANQTANNNAGAQTVPNWATAISAGPANESGQTLTFQVTSNTNPSLFSVLPAIGSNGTLTYTPAANTGGTATITINLRDNGGTANGGVDTSPSQTFNLTVVPVSGVISFSTDTYNTTESSGFVTTTVKRTGDLSRAVTVDYATSNDNGVPCSTANGVATPKCDFTAAFGTLNFAAGENAKTVTIVISQDTFVEGPETFSLLLSNPTSGAALTGPSTATIAMADDVTEPSTNPIDDARNFVRQHYHDFLNREPDQSGWDFWANQITACGSDAQCLEVRRINVSASFFLSIEFQQTGYFVERFYKVGYGDAPGTSNFQFNHQIPVPTVRLHEFLKDTQRIGQGVIVLQPGWEQVLENNKQAYALEFVQTSRFIAALPTTLSPDQFVDRLNQNTGGVLNLSERTAVINLFGGAPNTNSVTARAQAVRLVVDDNDLYKTEFNRAFVLAQYFGYLRRNPNDAPETTLDYTGYDFWLTKLNQFNGDYINSEMVKAFLSSIEYRQRFGT